MEEPASSIDLRSLMRDMFPDSQSRHSAIESLKDQQAHNAIAEPIYNMLLSCLTETQQPTFKICS